MLNGRRKRLAKNSMDQGRCTWTWPWLPFCCCCSSQQVAALRHSQSLPNMGCDARWRLPAGAFPLTAKTSGHKIAIVLPLHGWNTQRVVGIFKNWFFSRFTNCTCQRRQTNCSATAFVARRQSSMLWDLLAFPPYRSWLLRLQGKNPDGSFFKISNLFQTVLPFSYSSKFDFFQISTWDFL